MAEPIAGWIDNVYGPTGVVVGAAVGLLHSLQCDPEKVADLVPGDYVVNATIAAAWRTAKDYTGNHEAPPSDLDPPVYNFVSSVDKPLTWKKFMHLTEFYGLNCPTMHAVWYYILYLNPQKWLHTLVCLLLHWIPAYLVDSVLVLMGKKPMLVQAYRKIHKFSEVITYFSTQEWKFENANTKQLYETMRPADRDAFNFDLTRLTWSEYFSTYVKGVRTYLMKDPVETIPGATRKYYMFKCLHYVASCVFFYLLYKLLSFLLLSIF
ncbi:Fatty acyl-CoA reductase wat [Eumeta japonica]|uniref:Fatty acyl-CoA reductase n=1 Tax=Eumeta variegata TaxID=151549 RepID=A0A4C1Z9I8_EUMVA|nr:Fatty acyl-CoA reductase wat [Eumeta japonica]